MPDRASLPLTAAHWGVYRAEVRDGRLQALHPFEQDPDPSEIADGYVDALDGPLRIRAPMVRKSWLAEGPGETALRGEEPFVEISWDRAEELVAGELTRVRTTFGNQAIFGGSYGWASAGRFHHAQSQLHRFLNCIGGYTRSVNSYSLAAGEVILKHVLGDATGFIHGAPTWQSVIENAELVVAFGGMPLRNAQVSSGGTGRHRAREALSHARAAGVTFVNISPIRGDVAEDLGAHWLPPRPGSDVAVMLGLAHEILTSGWQDDRFLATYTTGFDRFAAYLTGETDGIAKTPAWAEARSGVPASEIAALARRMASSRTMISASWSLTRQENGEQPFWMATTLAAMLGQIGQPGRGVAFGYCAANSMGNERSNARYAALPQLENPVAAFIPVARISDMLLHPGAPFRYDGQTLRYPEVKLVYWAGGNPFHHHQDLTRLSLAWQKPETVIVHDWCWNPLARRADIVLPCTTPLERDDLMMSPRDRFIVAMRAVLPPVGQSRDDYEILSGLARRMGVEARFTEGRDATAWLRALYEESRERAANDGIDLPEHAELLKNGWHETPAGDVTVDAFTAFVEDPVSAPLHTPSGRIEIFSETIAAAGGIHGLSHPAWHAPEEWLGTAQGAARFHLLSSQPPDKLHSQLDQGRHSRAHKRNGRTPVAIHPEDARDLGIDDGDTVRISSPRGACLATVTLEPGILRGVVRMSTGAWLDPIRQADGTLMCQHGNPNTVTQDRGTSDFAQGPSALSCLVAITAVDQPAESAAFLPPSVVVSDV